MPEYLRIIERGALRTYGQYAAPISVFASALLCILGVCGQLVHKAFATVRYLKRV